jgi:hypothetical protein
MTPPPAVHPNVDPAEAPVQVVDDWLGVPLTTNLI